MEKSALVKQKYVQCFGREKMCCFKTQSVNNFDGGALHKYAIIWEC